MSEYSIIPGIGISASGLDAENRRMEVIANNVANANSTKGADGKVFRRKEVIFAAKLASELGAGDQPEQKLKGVELDAIIDDQSPLKRIYRPGHPSADAEGYVEYPNVNTVEEMVDMMGASRAYEANLAAVKTAKRMTEKALELMK